MASRRVETHDGDIITVETALVPIPEDQIHTVGDALIEGARIEQRIAQIEETLYSLRGVTVAELNALNALDMTRVQYAVNISLRVTDATMAFESAVMFQNTARYEDPSYGENRRVEHRLNQIRMQSERIRRPDLSIRVPPPGYYPDYLEETGDNIRGRSERRESEISAAITAFPGEVNWGHLCAICLGSFTLEECARPCTITHQGCTCRPGTQIYGTECISTWLRDQNTCPTCRNRVLQSSRRSTFRASRNVHDMPGVDMPPDLHRFVYRRFNRALHGSIVDDQTTSETELETDVDDFESRHQVPREDPGEEAEIGHINTLANSPIQDAPLPVGSRESGAATRGPASRIARQAIQSHGQSPTSPAGEPEGVLEGYLSARLLIRSQRPQQIADAEGRLPRRHSQRLQERAAVENQLRERRRFSSELTSDTDETSVSSTEPRRPRRSLVERANVPNPDTTRPRRMHFRDVGALASESLPEPQHPRVQIPDPGPQRPRARIPQTPLPVLIDRPMMTNGPIDGVSLVARRLAEPRRPRVQLPAPPLPGARSGRRIAPQPVAAPRSNNNPTENGMTYGAAEVARQLEDELASLRTRRDTLYYELRPLEAERARAAERPRDPRQSLFTEGVVRSYSDSRNLLNLFRPRRELPREAGSIARVNPLVALGGVLGGVLHGVHGYESPYTNTAVPTGSAVDQSPNFQSPYRSLFSNTAVPTGSTVDRGPIFQDHVYPYSNSAVPTGSTVDRGPIRRCGYRPSQPFRGEYLVDHTRDFQRLNPMSPFPPLSPFARGPRITGMPPPEWQQRHPELMPRMNVTSFSPPDAMSINVIRAAVGLSEIPLAYDATPNTGSSVRRDTLQEAEANNRTLEDSVAMLDSEMPDTDHGSESDHNGDSYDSDDFFNTMNDAAHGLESHPDEDLEDTDEQGSDGSAYFLAREDI